MKHLITLTLFFAACHPVRNLQVDQPDLHRITDSGIMTTDSIGTRFVIGTLVYNYPLYAQVDRLDTIHESMLISTRLPGITVVRYGQAIRRNGICIAHMDCHGQLLKPPVYVWSCETKLKREGK
jgi:hypothetical protein